jgi:hypothetical protein
VALWRTNGKAQGPVGETYLAAIQHELVDLAGEEHLAGVVRRPTGGFHVSVDENYPDLAPPEDLVEETKQLAEEFKIQGMYEGGAHNATVGLV